MPATHGQPLWKQLRAERCSAAQLLSRFGVTKPAVPVEKIVMQLGVELIHVTNAGWDGVLRIEGDKAYVFVNSSTSVPRQRFTIAHELGHLMLSHGDLEHRDMVTAGSADPKEREANAFAAQLLMPHRWVLDHLMTRHSVDEMAKIFGVSASAMNIRIESMRVARAFG